MTEFPRVTRSQPRAVEQGWRAPRAPWPNGAHCIAAITIDFDGPSHETGRGLRPLGINSAGRYAGRCGVKRHLEMLDRVGIKATFFIPGYDAECYPEVVKEIDRRGHEIGAHGYLHERMVLPAAEEDRRLVLTHEILTKLLGKAPAGWRSPSGQKTYNTLEVLRRLGYRWDSSDKDADMPYTLNLGGGKTMAEIPNNTYSLDDFPWFHFSMTPVSEIVPQWLQEFDAIYADRGFFMLTVHPRSSWGSGGPARTQALEAVIRYAQQHAGVKFVTLSELANWVVEHPSEFDEVTV